MTTTFQTTNSIGAGVRFLYAADDDSYFVLQGVTVASTDSNAISSLFEDNVLQVDGSVYSSFRAINMLGDRAVVTIGETGIIGSAQNSGGTAVYLSSLQSTLTNFGQISGNNSIAVTTGKSFVSIENQGSISGSSGVFLGLFGGTGFSVVNGGTISASAHDDAVRSFRYNNAVHSEGGDTLVTNLASGILSAVSSEGAGIRFDGSFGGTSMSGSTAVNYGEISSLQYFGVYFSGLTGDTVTLQNFGTITGGAGAFMGHDEIDIVHNGGHMVGDVSTGGNKDKVFNSGQINGDVDLGNGADVFRAYEGSQVTGGVAGGAGDDMLFGSSADETLDGGADADELRGAGGDDELLGGASGDTIWGGSGDDDVRGQNGNDDVSGGKGDDNVTGGGGNDTLNGNNGNDTLIGGSGNDTLTGGSDDDTLTGSSGADVFVFGLRTRDDILTDFEDGTDLIDLSDYNLVSRTQLNNLGGLSDSALGVLLDLSAVGGDGVILLQGITKSQLSDADFIF